MSKRNRRKGDQRQQSYYFDWRLAEAKARKVASEYPDAVVISGDAVVSKGNRIYVHSPTGRIAVGGGNFRNISFRSLVEREIEGYINQYAVLSHAGAFERDAVLRFAERISGSYNFVTASPVSRLIVFLRTQGVDAPPSLTMALTKEPGWESACSYACYNASEDSSSDMKCPFCGFENDKVVDSRESKKPTPSAAGASV